MIYEEKKCIKTYNNLFIVGMICQYSLNLLKVRDKGVLLEA